MNQVRQKRGNKCCMKQNEYSNATCGGKRINGTSFLALLSVLVDKKSAIDLTKHLS